MTYGKRRTSRRGFVKRVGAIGLSGLLATKLKLSSPATALAAANTIGLLNPRYPLGIANLDAPNAPQFARMIMLLPASGDSGTTPLTLVASAGTPNAIVPIYGLIKHNTTFRNGSPGDATVCGTADAESASPYILRQVAANDSLFGRRNISIGGAYSLLTYKNATSNQLFFFENEPVIGTSPRSSNPICTACSANEPVFNTTTGQPEIDPDAAPCVGTFYESGSAVTTFVQDCTNTSVGPFRIRTATLAKLFLRYKGIVETGGQNHILLPPASETVSFGLGGNIVTDPTMANSTTYWSEFFRFTHTAGFGGTDTCMHPSTTPPTSLHALHAHHYHDIGSAEYGGGHLTDPLYATASAAISIRRGVEWYRSTYTPGFAQLPLNYVLSEMGPMWDRKVKNPAKDNRAWTNGYRDMMNALAYWNGWLRWLTRNARADANLDTNQTFYAMLHEPELAPFMMSEDLVHTLSNPTPLQTRAQKFFDFASPVAGGSSVNAEIYTVNALPTHIDYTSGTVMLQAALGTQPGYSNSWTIINGTARTHLGSGPDGLPKSQSYYFAPFGVTYTVWSHIGGDSSGVALGTGWFNDGATAGVKGQVTLTIPGGWSTVYIPFAKPAPSANQDSQCNFYYRFDWVIDNPNGTTSVYSYGQFNMHYSVFPNSKLFFDGDDYTLDYGALTNKSQIVNSAMLCPLLVCNGPVGTATKTVKLRLTRLANSGQDAMGITIGRPIVLGGVGCTWTSVQ